ncbi:hypothetical protein SAMD00019534_047610, partial [Acytostelium subglobosum LB1]|uniref:hypothetical protein n=1 Tax=Acytostelium subglobosum LB1 TaxID=1410327 RepID=UPI0006451558
IDMSSMNVRRLLPNREKRERSQPAAVKGFMERKKDYVKRARDHNYKKNRIKKLKVQAALKNPDEFRFQMISSKIINGVHHNISKTKLEDEQLLDIKSQDQQYLQGKRVSEEKKIDRLQAELQYIDAGLKPTDHMIFLDGDKEVKKFNAVKHFDTIPEAFSQYSSTIPLMSRLKQGSLVVNPHSAPSLAEIEAMTATSYKELEARKQRREELYKAERELDSQKNQI